MLSSVISIEKQNPCKTKTKTKRKASSNSKSSQTEKDFLDIKNMIGELNDIISKNKTTYYENIGKMSNDKL